MTHTSATIWFQIIQSSAVVIDPVVYIICHEKYRKAIKKLLYNWTCKKIAILETESSTHKLGTMKKTVNRANTLTRSSPRPSQMTTPSSPPFTLSPSISLSQTGNEVKH